MAESSLMHPKASQQQALRTLVADDESVIRGPLGLCLETLGHQVFEAASVDEALACAARQTLDIALVDLRLGTSSGLDLMTQLLALQPRLRIIIITAYGSVDVAVRAMGRGATDFLCKPFTPDQVAVAVARAASLRDLESDVGILPDRRGTGGPEADFATTSEALQDAIMTVRQAAPTLTPILISGEAGIGKSVLARAIHGWSQRPEGPFVAVDCSARSAAYNDLVLFGDAFAGDQIITADQPSLVTKAGGGTLLIKHVESLSMQSQRRLADLLETHDTRVQGHGVSPSGCRIVATTISENPVLQPPLGMLLDRIHVSLPSLRQRPDDIPMLAQRYLAFARQNTGRHVLGFAVEALDRLVSYGWPENLRELHAVVEQAFGSATAGYITDQDLPDRVRDSTILRRPRAGDPVSLRDLEIAHIREVLASNIPLPRAAEILGLDLQALYRRRKQYGIE